MLILPDNDIHLVIDSHQPWQAKFPNDNTTQQSVPAKPVDAGYAVTNVDTVVAKDKKKGKKVHSYVCLYV